VQWYDSFALAAFIDKGPWPLWALVQGGPNRNVRWCFRTIDGRLRPALEATRAIALGDEIRLHTDEQVPVRGWLAAAMAAEREPAPAPRRPEPRAQPPARPMGAAGKQPAWPVVAAGKACCKECGAKATWKLTLV
jgi:hypothetical protein